MKSIKKIILLLLCAVFIIPQTGCGSEEPVSENAFCLDTICTITIYGLKEKEAGERIQEAFQLCRDYEKMMSKTVEGSDVYKINHSGGKPVTVQDETLAVIKKGIQYGELSQGKFDITIGAVSDLWDFSGENPKVPDADKLAQAVKTVDYGQIQIDGNKVSLKNRRAKLDLGGIAKGYIADRVGDLLEKQGVEHAVVSLGGNIVAIGNKLDESPWIIGIERPYSDRSEIVGSVKLEDATIATSGVYERCFRQDGKLYHHVLDPDTGYPVKTDLEAVTVTGRLGSSVDCDALGTVCLMLGKEKSRKLFEQFPELKGALIDEKDEVIPVSYLDITKAE